MRACPDGGLHVALTHGMKPFGATGGPKHNTCCRLLYGALNEASNRPQDGEREIVKAYRKSKASQKRYPNSAELLRTVIGTSRLSGGITEVCQTKHEELKKAWRGSGIVVAQSSWREKLDLNSALACPKHLKAPWLFSMDPMTYTENESDTANLYCSDLGLLIPALKRYVASGHPGIACFFVYCMTGTKERQFWKFMDNLARCLSVPTCSYWLPHQRANRNLAGLLFSKIELCDDFIPPEIKTGRVN